MSWEELEAEYTEMYNREVVNVVNVKTEVSNSCDLVMSHS